MSEELKPCRCCGKPPDVNIRYTSVWCISPRDECPYSKLAMSPDEWNTRPIEDALRAELAAKDSLIVALEECLKAVDDNWSLSTQRAAWFKLEAARARLAQVREGRGTE